VRKRAGAEIWLMKTPTFSREESMNFCKDPEVQQVETLGKKSERSIGGRRREKG